MLDARHGGQEICCRERQAREPVAPSNMSTGILVFFEVPRSDPVVRNLASGDHYITSTSTVIIWRGMFLKKNKKHHLTDYSTFLALSL